MLPSLRPLYNERIVDVARGQGFCVRVGYLSGNFFSNISKRISRTKNEIAVPASLHSIRELSAKEKNRRRIEEQREAQHFEYVKRSGSLKHAEIRPQRSAYQGIRYGLYRNPCLCLNSLNHSVANHILY